MADRLQRVAAIMLISPAGHVLMMRRVDTGEWAFPAGGIEAGESAEEAALRELEEETGFHLTATLQRHMQRIRDGVDCTTFVAGIDREFAPRLNHEHTAHGWFLPKDVLKEAAALQQAQGDGEDDLRKVLAALDRYDEERP